MRSFSGPGGPGGVGGGIDSRHGQKSVQGHWPLWPPVVSRSLPSPPTTYHHLPPPTTSTTTYQHHVPPPSTNDTYNTTVQ